MSIFEDMRIERETLERHIAMQKQLEIAMTSLLDLQKRTAALEKLCLLLAERS